MLATHCASKALFLCIIAKWENGTCPYAPTLKVLAADFPEGHSAGGGHIEGINLMGHGYLHGEVAIGDGGRRQAVAFSSQDECQLLGACDMLNSEV